MSEVHYLKVSNPIHYPTDSRITGPVTFETACGTHFAVGMAGTDNRSRVTCPKCQEVIKQKIVI